MKEVNGTQQNMLVNINRTIQDERGVEYIKVNPSKLNQNCTQSFKVNFIQKGWSFDFFWDDVFILLATLSSIAFIAGFISSSKSNLGPIKKKLMIYCAIIGHLQDNIGDFLYLLT